MAADGSYRITVQQGPNPGKIYVLTKDVITVGRDVSNDIVFNDAEASRHHARLTWQGQGYVIEDLGSTNGTFVNGVRLNAQRLLNHGDVVSLGETVHLAYEAAHEDAAATVVAGDVSMPPPPPVQQTASSPPPVAQPAVPPVAPASVQPAAGSNNRTRNIAIGAGALLFLCCCITLIVFLLIPCETWLPIYRLIGLTC